MPKSQFHVVRDFMQARVETVLMMLVMFAVVAYFIPIMRKAVT